MARHVASDGQWARKNYCKSLGASPVSHARLTLLLSSEVALFMSRRFRKVTARASENIASTTLMTYN